MLDANTRQLVKATVPVLKEHGVTLTSHFYQRMFRHNPELKHLFNQGHQASGQQQTALALAVLGYAENIDDPSVLAPVVGRIAHKHASLGIRAEHYPIVGGHLLASIREVLGDAASDELIAAWAAAYGQLADILIAAEAELYRNAALAEGGWSGWRPFKVGRKVRESDEITSFYLYPVDGAPVPSFVPGQYISVRGRAAGGALIQPRQYSLSDAPNPEYLRLSIKREQGDASRPDGLISNWMHDEVEEGTLVELAPPFGDFVLDTDKDSPVVLISGGVGLTPMVSMLNQLVQEQPTRRVAFVHAARNRQVHALNDHVRSLAERHPQLNVQVFYEHASNDDRLGVDYEHQGRIDLAAIRDTAIVPDADYYLCGPVPFMRAQLASLQELGVPAERIHYEVFGSHVLAAA
ncbi:NO-inducible flavohemoprotein [Crenobacter sp. SG2305]|uniref:NO-inducible flavohemoprotein n=1 Tax=Crenobacter oryzisoli TaxID=3056844 RepID=UPI0025AA6E78|nr:NO-inducible flavohemoprotein [Crenobacter sp. SG2305]MDN0081536.1 NO-inducible flavohemoprotein [Crenobacter sp. SG2305]